MGAFFDKGGPGGFKGKGKDPNKGKDFHFERVQKAGVDRIVEKVLTAEQKARWQELTGAPFQGNVRMFFGFAIGGLPRFPGFTPPGGKDGPSPKDRKGPAPGDGPFPKEKDRPGD